MYTYSVCQSILASNVRIAELIETEGAPDLRFEVLPPRQACAVSCERLHEWRAPDGKTWLYFGPQSDGYLFRFPAYADFCVSIKAGEIECFPLSGIPPETINHLLLDQVLPLLLSREGRLVLHASAVTGPEGAIAFLGRSGWGKSTLAGSFVSCGFSLLTDDCLAVIPTNKGVWGMPSYPSLRLWPEAAAELFQSDSSFEPVSHYSRKQRVGPAQMGSRFATAGQHLVRIYVLAEPAEASESNAVEIRSVPPKDAFFELLQFAFTIDLTGAAALRAQFKSLARVTADSTVRGLSFPRDYQRLASVRESILRDMAD